MRIVIPDDDFRLFEGTEALARLRALGHVSHHTDRPADEGELLGRVTGAEIILTTRYLSDFRSTDILDRLPALRMISVMGTRARMIDMKRAAAKRIVVSVTPAASTPSVAEHTIMLTLALAKRLPSFYPAMRAGGWPQDQGVELGGKTMGLLGFGNIGRAVSRMARGLGMRVVAWSPSMTPERASAAGAEAVSLEACLGADVVSLHIHLPAGSPPFLTRERIGRMKPGAFFINTARARLVDEEALSDALRAGRIAGAGLDVFEPFEPLPEDSPWRSLDNVLITPHSAWITDGTYSRFTNLTVDNIEAYLKGAPQNLVAEDA